MKPTTTVEADHVVIRWPLSDVINLVQRNVEQNTEWTMRDYKTADMVRDAIRTAINDESFRPTLIAIVQEALKVVSIGYEDAKIVRVATFTQEVHEQPTNGE